MICRTPEECVQAGWDDAADHPPLTDQEIERLAILHGPYLRTDELGMTG